MTANQLVPAAQYLRMSTEHQQYSLENQSTAVQTYAASQGFEVVQSYADASKSGLVLKRRAGLQQLLQDVVSGNAKFKAILVYDISRWGRFQDTDESAHYEFLCKSAGIPVHYCAETFANDGSLPSSILKALKRAMASEYSREMGVKILAGLKYLAHLGFKQGGAAGYGLRRMLVSSGGVPKHELAKGERKGMATDRVILVLGPAHEIQTVRDIFRLFISEQLPVYAIATELNRRHIPYLNDSRWDYQAVYTVLTHPKYAGIHVFGRTSSRLYTPKINRPKSEWVLTAGAFEPTVSTEDFQKAQNILAARTINKSDTELLDSLRALLASKGRLSLRLIQESPEMASPSTYRHRFGNLRHAYELIGYGRPEQFGPIDLRSRTAALRGQFIAQLTSLFPHEVTTVTRGGRWRSRLRLKNGLIVSVLIVRCIKVWTSTVRWQIDPIKRECKYVTLVARLDEQNGSIMDLHILPRMDRRGRFRISQNDPYLQRGIRLDSISDFCRVIEQVRAIRNGN